MTQEGSNFPHKSPIELPSQRRTKSPAKRHTKNAQCRKCREAFIQAASQAFGSVQKVYKKCTKNEGFLTAKSRPKADQNRYKKSPFRPMQKYCKHNAKNNRKRQRSIYAFEPGETRTIAPVRCTSSKAQRLKLPPCPALRSRFPFCFFVC